MILPRSLFLVFALVSSFTIVWAQAGCDTYFPMRAGVTWSRDYYDGEGKLLRSSRAVLTASETNPAAVVVAETTPRGPEKTLHTTRYTMTCTAADLVIDLAAKVNTSYFDMPGRTVQAISPGLVYPHAMSVGTALPSTGLVVTYWEGDSEVMRNTTLIQNRRVTGREVKTVAAGSFDCLVIEEDHTFDDGQEIQQTQIKIWLSKGVGIVATESFEAGKRGAYSELSALQR
jgi:hypothetical protein